jgi:hypothetical protein
LDLTVEQVESHYEAKGEDCGGWDLIGYLNNSLRIYLDQGKDLSLVEYLVGGRRD